MKKQTSKYYATINGLGEIVSTSDSTKAVELKENQIPLTEKELAIIRIIDGDFNYGRNLIRDIEARIISRLGE